MSKIANDIPNLLAAGRPDTTRVDRVSGPEEDRFAAELSNASRPAETKQDERNASVESSEPASAEREDDTPSAEESAVASDTEGQATSSDEVSDTTEDQTEAGEETLGSAVVFVTTAEPVIKSPEVAAIDEEGVPAVAEGETSGEQQSDGKAPAIEADFLASQPEDAAPEAISLSTDTPSTNTESDQQPASLATQVTAGVTGESAGAEVIDVEAAPVTSVTLATAGQDADGPAAESGDERSNGETAITAVTSSTGNAEQESGEQHAGHDRQQSTEQVTTTSQGAAAEAGDETEFVEKLATQPSTESDAATSADATEVRTTDRPADAPPVDPANNLARLAAGRVPLSRAEQAGGSEQAPQVDASRFVSRVSRAIQTAQERGGEVRLRLSPPELGALQIKLTLGEGTIAATLETETTAARNVLLDNLPALRERLAEQEIRIEKFDVDVQQEGSSQQDWAPGERQEGGNDQQGAGSQSSAQAITEESALAAADPGEEQTLNADAINLVI
ncbi:MAG: flagellar hook-length control protein FliK [Planctomycetota bacterium]